MTRLGVIVCTRPLCLAPDFLTLDVAGRSLGRGRKRIFFLRGKANYRFEVLRMLLIAYALDRRLHMKDLVNAIYDEREDGGPDWPHRVFYHEFNRMRLRLDTLGLSIAHPEMRRGYGLAPVIVDLALAEAA